jgi:complex I intermediate-associated protein 30 (CIA30)
MPAGDRRATSRLFLLVLSFVAGGALQAQHDALLVADFDGEKADTNSGLSLWLYADDQLGGTSEARASLIHPGADTSRGAVRLSFRVAGEFRAPFSGAWAMVGPEGLATDLSAYKGVRFYARSKDGTAFTAGIVRFQGLIMRYMTPFEIRPEWTLIEIPFDRFRQVPSPGTTTASAAGLDPKDITSIGFSVASQLRGRFELDVDRIELYR